MGSVRFCVRFSLLRACAQRLKLFSLLSLLVLAVGCGQDLGSTEEDGGGSAEGARSLSTHSFGREVQLSFVDPVRGTVSSPMMLVPREKIEELRRAGEIRAQESVTTNLRQFTYFDEEPPGYFGTLITDDPSGYPTCYTPTSPDDNIFGGIVDTGGTITTLSGLGGGQNTITYQWTLPDDGSDKPTLVSFGRSVDPYDGFSDGDNDYYEISLPDYVEAQGNVVTLRYEISRTFSQQGYTWNWQAYVNNALVDEQTLRNDATYELVLMPPVFKSTSHGLHTIHQLVEGDDGLQIGFNDANHNKTQQDQTGPLATLTSIMMGSSIQTTMWRQAICVQKRSLAFAPYS